MLLKTPGSLVTRSFGWRPKKEQSVSQFFRIFGRSFWSGSGRLRDNRRMTDAAHNNRVAEVADRFGFTHLGRFAGTYRATFGEAPSTTLKRIPGVPLTGP